MKIRIKDNSIRYRLTRTEVEKVYKEGSFIEKTDFGTGYFSYGVQVDDVENNLKATFDDNTVTLIIPKTFVEKWYTTDVVGFEYNMALPNGDKLFLLLEKDFVCMDDNRENQEDNYPNPLIEKIKN